VRAYSLLLLRQGVVIITTFVIRFSPGEKKERRTGAAALQRDRFCILCVSIRGRTMLSSHSLRALDKAVRTRTAKFSQSLPFILILIPSNASIMRGKSVL
jgi:hypothetical protein